MGAPSALAAVTASARRRDGPSIGEDTKKQQSGSTPVSSFADGRFGQAVIASGVHGRILSAFLASLTVAWSWLAWGRRPAQGRYERRLLTKLSAMELPSPPSSGIKIQAHR